LADGSPNADCHCCTAFWLMKRRIIRTICTSGACALAQTASYSPLGPRTRRSG
jgi:hypothetical protein